MGKTVRKTNPKDGKEEDIQKLRNKLQDRKAQVRRLQSYIRELEKKLEDVGKPVKESKIDKAPKLTQEEKAKQAKEDLRKRLKEKYGRKNE